MGRDLLYHELEQLSSHEVAKPLPVVQPSSIHLYNTDLSAPYSGGNFDFAYVGGSSEATVTFRTFVSFRRNFSEKAKKLFKQNLERAVAVWDNAAELRLRDLDGKYDTRIRLRFKLEFVNDVKHANKKTDVHPDGRWSSWFNGAGREIVMRDLNVFIGSSRNVLVHELGHVWGLLDEYDTKWIEMKFSPGHVGSGSPLLADKQAIMNLGYQDEYSNSGEFRTRYFMHVGRKILDAFWGLKRYMHPIVVGGRTVATTVSGRIYLLKKDIHGSPADTTSLTAINPLFSRIQVSRRGHVKARDRELEL